MRTKRATKNLIINFFTFIIGFIPVFWLRKVFLDSLGEEYLGLHSLFSSIIGIISLAELGIASVILYSLYQPYAEGNREKIRAYINYYSRIYRIIGLSIFTIGLLLMPALNLFVQDGVNIEEAQLFYLLFLINTNFTYFFSMRLCILTVAEEGYKIAVAYTMTKLTTAFLQILILNFYADFYAFLIIQIFMTLLYFLGMNLYIRKKYPWIYSSAEKLEAKEQQLLVKNVRAFFLHKIGGVAVFSTDNLLISYFLNLTVVGIYNSYYLIIGAMSNLVSSALSAVAPSVGNLLVEGDHEKIFLIHKRLFFFSFWIVSFLSISLFNTLKQFVLLWLGDSQVLDDLTIGLLILIFYMSLMRASVEIFKAAGGIFQQDQLSPILEAIINLAASIVLVRYLGLPGVFLGTLISIASAVFWVKPKMVYKYIFKRKLSLYFTMYFKFFGIGLIPLFLTYIATKELQDSITLFAFLLNCLINILVVNTFYLILFRNNGELIYYKNLASKMLRRKEGMKLEESNYKGN
ncbi:lipopolysaccharide biosynthesis protein [Planococcus koreensis]|uniref:lipopolysaccharide biosynthesis protein n=1 Tax=Planococcus koreensis TaxID=112331 RepID=UPI0039FC4C06